MRQIRLIYTVKHCVNSVKHCYTNLVDSIKTLNSAEQSRLLIHYPLSFNLILRFLAFARNDSDHCLLFYPYRFAFNDLNSSNFLIFSKNPFNGSRKSINFKLLTIHQVPSGTSPASKIQRFCPFPYTLSYPAR
mgnify:CR=1 FL=1